MLKLVSFESLAGNDFSAQGTQTEAHCERNPNRQLWRILKQKKIISSLFKELLHIIKSGGASLKV